MLQNFSYVSLFYLLLDFTIYLYQNKIELFQIVKKFKLIIELITKIYLYLSFDPFSMMSVPIP